MPHDEPNYDELARWQADLGSRPRRESLDVDLVGSYRTPSVWSVDVDPTPTSVILLMTLVNDAAAAARRLLLPEVPLENAVTQAALALDSLTQTRAEQDASVGDERRIEMGVLLREFLPTLSEEVTGGLAGIEQRLKPTESTSRKLRSLWDQTRTLADPRILASFLQAEAGTPQALRRDLATVASQLRRLINALNDLLDDPLTWGALGDIRIEGVRPGSTVTDVAGASGELTKAVAQLATIGPTRRAATDLGRHEEVMQLLSEIKAYDAMRPVLSDSFVDVLIDQLKERLVAIGDERLTPEAQQRVAQRASRPLAVLQSIGLEVREVSPRHSLEARREPLPRQPPGFGL